MNYFDSDIKSALDDVNSSEDGLSQTQADQRLAAEGKNAIEGGRKKPFILKFLSQFADPMIIVLLVAAVVSSAVALVQKQYAELTDGAIILLIVVLNAVIGLVQESKAENALEALRNNNKPYAKVIREGERKTIPTEELVRGDIVVLEAGDIVPADLRLISSSSLKIEESALTGESVPVEKDAQAVISSSAALGDRVNMAYSTGTVTYGRGSGVVVATGMHTETGKIARMLKEVQNSPSPLNRQLAKTAKILSVGVLAVALIIFLVSVFAYGREVMNAFMTAVAIAVAAIPEGLPAVVTIVLAMGVQKMSKRRAIVKNLPSVETLGCCEVICSDKTGTLTLNRMTVRDTYCPSGKEELLNAIMALCNDTAKTEDGLAGDPTETALVAYAEKCGKNFEELTAENPRINELPFDSVRKLMTTVHKTAHGQMSYTKGAPDILLSRCAYILTAEGVKPLDEEAKKAVSAANAAMADRALRVLAAAYTEGNTLEERDMVFVGLTGMIDPPREEVKAAVAECRSAGIHVVMITGDHPATAKAIAKELGIMRDGDLTATGAELDAIPDEQLYATIERYSVFSRVSPENKVRIVKAFRHNGKVTAMTGDGVNDAPSIKEADIGIGMGITGTQVSKEAADIILTDDNFATIEGAVKEGRKIFSNITKAIQFLLSANIAEVLCLFIATVILDVEFLTPVMILWVNLVTDSFPALSLGTEDAEKDVMKMPPRKSNTSLFAGTLGKDILIQGAIQTALVMLSFCIGNYVLADGVNNHDVAMTMAFVSLCFLQLFHSFNLRSQRDSVLNRRFFTNKYLNLSALLGIALTLLVILVPFFNDIFHTAQLNVYEWLIAVGVAIAIIPLVELQKLIERLIARRRAKKAE